jgi:hypothetical protein
VSLLDLEALRRTFMPPKVRVLFVGESPPAGGTFFYLGNSTLYRHTKEAFSRVYGERVVNSCPSGFLGYFRDRGCYLEDLCSEPVNHLVEAEKRRICRASVPGLSRRLAQGDTSYEDARKIVLETAESSMKEDKWNEQVTAWKEELGIKTYLKYALEPLAK